MDDDAEDIERTFAEIINEQESERLGGNSRRYGTLDNAQHGFSLNATNGVDNFTFSADGTTIEGIRLNMMGGNGIGEENSSLVRRHTRRAKEVAEGIEDIIEEMPSRTVGRRRGEKLNNRLASLKFSSVRSRRMRIASLNDEVDANEIYEEIAMQDGEIDPHELRNLSVNMTLKKQVRNQAQKERQKQKHKSISCFSLWKHHMQMKWRYFKDDFGKFISSASFWNYHMKQIEGHFGTGVSSYFIFLRGIFFLSIPSFLLSFTFISIPQLLDPPEHVSCSFTGEEILTGANCLTDTIMYQGYYTNKTINEIGNTYYDMPLAYLFATFGYFLLCFIWLATTTAISFRQNYIDAKEEGSNFISKVFCAWDFGTTSQSTAKLQHKSISTELKEILAEQKLEDDHRTKCEKFEVFLMRLVSWTFFFGLVAGSMVLVYKTNETLICQIKEQVTAPIFQDIVLAMIVSTINLLIPYVISFMTHLERYKYPRHELYISVLRNFLFKMSLLGIVCAFWTTNDLQSCEVENNTTSSELCWETELGQEIYRLMIIDFLFSILFATFCAEFLRQLLSRMTSVISSPEFSISNNVLDLVYAQTLCWIGVYFSPLLALINILKYFLLFYIKKVSVMRNCRVSKIRWRAAQSTTLFNIVQLLSFLLSTGFLAYVIFNQTPSVACGPFRTKSRAYDVIIEHVSLLAATTSGNWFATMLNIITNIWVLYALLTLFLVVVIFARSKSKGLDALADTLRDQIGLEGKDKTLLLKWLQNVSKHTMTYENYDGRQHLKSNAAVGIGNVVHTTPVYTRMAKARSMVVTEDDNSILEVPSTSGYENRVMSNVHIPDSNDVVLESRHSSTYNSPVHVHNIRDVNPQDTSDYNRYTDGDF